MQLSNGYGKPFLFTDDGSGNLTSITTSAIGNPHLFTGRRLDPETGLQYSRARYYNFDLGRFIGRDPIGYETRDVNLYRYVGDNPLDQFDPTGGEAEHTKGARPSTECKHEEGKSRKKTGSWRGERR